MPPFTMNKLSNLTTKQLRDLFYATFGIQTRSNNRPWMVKRIAAAPVFAPSEPPAAPAPTEPSASPAPTSASDAESAATTATAVPPVGSEIRRTFHGKEIVVTVVADGFRLKGKVYSSLSAAATALCGGNRNGLVFFGLKPRPAKAARTVS
jgi:hypothetical protein